uniref:Uncharacterized protein n=1 Tax=Solanum lycopersicum TaxID=4081 RepID=A0A3Q7G958_SOLLC
FITPSRVSLALGSTLTFSFSALSIVHSPNIVTETRKHSNPRVEKLQLCQHNSKSSTQNLVIITRHKNIFTFCMHSTQDIQI